MFTKNKTGYMAELDQWLDFTIFEPVKNAAVSRDAKELHICVAECKKLIKNKMLESYRNGLTAKQTSKFKADA